MSKLRILCFAFTCLVAASTFYYKYFPNFRVTSVTLSKVKNHIKFFPDIKSFAYNITKTSSARVALKPRDKLAILAYVPADNVQTFQFLVMLHGSWRYIVEHQSELFSGNEFDEINDIDLLAFCVPSVCKDIHSVCTPIKELSEIVAVHSISRCYAVEQSFEVDIPYGFLNSFAMFNRTDITELIPKYEYVLRTDNDVFITPAMYKLKPTSFLYGVGAYSHPFNMKRLKEIAVRINMTHKGKHDIGSTWCGDTAFCIKAGKLTLDTAKYIYLYEFDPKSKGLETIDFKKDSRGEWIRWWRGVSSLYGAELALNHLITDISDQNKGQLDSNSCDKTNIWKTFHIHCWRFNCEFDKVGFINQLTVGINAQGSLSGGIVRRIMENGYLRNITNMSLQEYSTYIAWSSSLKYLRKWFVK